MGHGRRRYLVSYDIRDDKRLRQVHKTLKAYGWPMQYSVFVCDLDSMELTSLRMDLGTVIHHAIDSVAMVDLGEPSERGRRCFTFMGIAPALPVTGPTVL